MFGSTRLPRAGSKPVIRIHKRVSKVVEYSAVKIIRACSRTKDDLTSWRATKFRGKGRCLNAELLQCIHGDQTAGPTQCTKRLRSSCSGLARILPQTDAKICGYAVDSKTVCIGPLAS